MKDPKSLASRHIRVPCLAFFFLLVINVTKLSEILAALAGWSESRPDSFSLSNEMSKSMFSV